jgi:hypothetical protein
LGLLLLPIKFVLFSFPHHLTLLFLLLLHDLRCFKHLLFKLFLELQDLLLSLLQVTGFPIHLRNNLVHLRKRLLERSITLTLLHFVLGRQFLKELDFLLFQLHSESRFLAFLPRFQFPDYFVLKRI